MQNHFIVAVHQLAHKDFSSLGGGGGRSEQVFLGRSRPIVLIPLITLINKVYKKITQSS